MVQKGGAVPTRPAVATVTSSQRFAGLDDSIITDKNAFDVYIASLPFSVQHSNLVSVVCDPMPKCLDRGGIMMVAEDMKPPEVVHVTANKRPVDKMVDSAKPSATSHKHALNAFRAGDLKEWLTLHLTEAGRAGEIRSRIYFFPQGCAHAFDDFRRRQHEHPQNP